MSQPSTTITIIWVCLKIVYPYTQWFCWSLSLLNGYLFGNIPYFQTKPICLFLFKDRRSETLWNYVDHRCEGRVPLTALVLELALGIGCPPSLTPELQTIHQAALVKKVSKWVANDHRPTDHWARHRRGCESRWWPAHACGVGHEKNQWCFHS